MIVAGRLFLGGDNSFIYSLDAATGCVYWSFQSEAQVRTSIVIDSVSGHGSTKYAAYFGDRKANVYAVDARNGELLWKKNLEPRVLAHITGSPMVYQGRVYVGVAGFRRGGLGRSALPLLHVSRQPVGPRRRHRKSHLEKLHHPRGAEAHQEEFARHAALGARGRFHLEHADHRHQIARHLCFHRQRLHRAGGEDFGRHCGLRSADRQDAVVVSGRRERRVARRLQRPEQRASSVRSTSGPTGISPIRPSCKMLAGGKRILVAAHKGGTAVALDPDRKGALLWTADLTDGAKAGPGGQIMWGGAADDQNVYYSLQTGAVAAVKLADGSMAWLQHFDPADRRRAAGGRGAGWQPR